MKKIILCLGFLAALTGCPTQEEVKNMTEGVAERKASAIQVIQGRDFSLDGLMRAQEYFFDFSEKVHLLKVEVEAQKNFQRLIKKDGVAKFCQAFVLPIDQWKALEAHCSNGPFYKCSPEIKEYSNTLALLKSLAGSTYTGALANESSCN